jgi:hypothetical protein
MEYVRICDTYGVGFYYIPGTETCLKFSGYIRYDIGVGSLGFENVIDKSDAINSIIDGNFGDQDYDTNDSYYKRARFALRVDARQETELGTLRGFAQVNFNFDVAAFGDSEFRDEDDVWTYQSGDSFALNHAYIELGGFRVGKTDSLFSTFTGYSSGVSNDGLVPYGPFDTHQIAYTFTGGNGFTAAVALENGGGTWDRYDSDLFDIGPLTDIYELDSYVPHVVGGVGWTGGWGGFSVVAGYDSVWEEGAIKGRIDFNLGDAISMFVMAAYGTVDDDFGDDEIGDDVNLGDSPNYYAPWGGEYAIWVGGAWKFTEAATFNFEVGYDEAEDFSVAANVDYELVNNFHIIPEIVYYDKGDELTFSGASGYDIEDGDDEWGGFLRFQYNWGG